MSGVLVMARASCEVNFLLCLPLPFQESIESVMRGEVAFSAGVINDVGMGLYGTFACN